MEMVNKKKFDKVKPLVKEELKADHELTENEFQKLLEDMQNPVKAQQHLAVQIKNYLDKKMKTEMEEKGYMSDHTRRWADLYNQVLEKIQKALYGDKSINLHVHKVTHSQIAAKMREVQ